MSFLQGNPRPLGLSLWEGSSRPSTPAVGRNPRPFWSLGASPAPLCAVRSSLRSPERAGGRQWDSAGRLLRAPSKLRADRKTLGIAPPAATRESLLRRSSGQGAASAPVAAGAAVAEPALPGGAWVWTRQERLERLELPIHEQVKRPGCGRDARGWRWGLGVLTG